MVENKEKNFISAVVYVHNQQETIQKFLGFLVKQLQTYFEKYEIICVNDASVDNSVDEIRSFAQGITGGVISILNMSFYQGVELAMNAGVDLSIGDFVYEFDNLCLDYQENLVFDIYRHSLSGYDIVAAAPIHKQKFMSKLFYYIYNRVSDTQFKLQTETFRILSRRAINRVHSMSKTIPYRKAVYANCGLKMATLNYDNNKNSREKDISSHKKKKDIAVDTLILYSDAAYKFSIGITGALMLVTLLIGIYTIYIYRCWGQKSL